LALEGPRLLERGGGRRRAHVHRLSEHEKDCLVSRKSESREKRFREKRKRAEREAANAPAAPKAQFIYRDGMWVPATAGPAATGRHPTTNE
jgi:hypothetical protein